MEPTKLISNWTSTAKVGQYASCKNDNDGTDGNDGNDGNNSNDGNASNDGNDSNDCNDGNDGSVDMVSYKVGFGNFQFFWAYK